MTTTSIIPHEPAAIELLFQNGGTAIDPLIARIETEVRSHVADLTSKKGRDAIASLAHKVSKSKTALDAAGKSLTETQKAEIKQVDDARKKMRDRLDALRDEARKPLTDWETAEAEMAAKTEATMSDLRYHGLDGSETPEQIKFAADIIKDINLDHITGTAWEMANEVRAHTLASLRSMYAAAVQRDADAAELAALRAASDARDEADRVAQAERDRIEAERVAEAARVAAAEQAAQWAKEAEAKRVAQIEADKLAAVEAAKAEVEAEHARAAQQAAEIAAKAEAERVAAADAQAAREADVTHRAEIHDEIRSALQEMAGNSSPDQIATALMDGDIPHTKVTL